MSVLETPRIYFRGQVSWDPITTNNYDNYYDETDAETIFPNVQRKVAAFRKEAIAAVDPSIGSWNPHGTHRATFFDAAISGADCGAGLVTDDPFVASPANFLGMLVDAEPYGAFSSQLFFDAMTFGIDGGPRILAPRSTRFTARYINFGRNKVGAIAGKASVVWQTSFPKSGGLRVDAFDSHALQALATALEDDDVLGLTVRWNAYRTIYFDSVEAADPNVFATLAKELMTKLDGGGWQPNPARSVMAGVIGLWRKGEPVSEPGDRVLTGSAPPKAPSIATAYARLNGDSLVIDLSNSISEDDASVTKHDFGDLSVVAVDAGGTSTTLATFGYSSYDKTAYDATSGIVTLKVDASKAASGTLQLRDSSDAVRLAETPLRAIPLVPNQYLDENDAATAQFQLYDRGVAAAGGVGVTVCVMSSDGSTVQTTFTTSTSPDGTFSFPIGGAAGITAYLPLPGPNPQLPPNGINPLVNTYMYVRVLPADANIAAMPPTWANVYANVLANWHAMAPCMDNWLDLGNEAQIRAYGPLIRKLTDPATFEQFRYMPVVRDLSKGCRTLLYKFLDSGATLAAEAAPAEAAPDFAELSRMTRRR